ncbi:MAG: hypothetical protein A2Z25_01285 [Planctomycetes bacterium RBG_16_55_9]|nr:MAG: hypothetical protein A2Z25_01285 [Planctomycetes bacterium RBG_16_55_9]
MESKHSKSNSLSCKVDTATGIYEKYGDFIRKVIYLKIQEDENQAEDLFQNFFLRLISNPLSEDIRDMEAYLYKAITREITYSNRLTRNYWNFLEDYTEHNSHSYSLETPEKALLNVEEINKMFDLIEKRLPHTEAQAIRLRYREGLSIKGTAERMGVCSGTVRGYVCEGLRRIRRLLRDIAARTAE